MKWCSWNSRWTTWSTWCRRRLCTGTSSTQPACRQLPGKRKKSRTSTSATPTYRESSRWPRYEMTWWMCTDADVCELWACACWHRTSPHVSYTGRDSCFPSPNLSADTPQPVPYLRVDQSCKGQLVYPLLLLQASWSHTHSRPHSHRSQNDKQSRKHGHLTVQVSRL